MLELHEFLKAGANLAVRSMLRHGLLETVPLGRACMRVEHKRPSSFLKGPDGVWLPDPESYKTVGAVELVFNQITNSGLDQLHLQGYGKSGLASNGFNYIALTNNAISPGPTDTTLAGEITNNGLARTQGTYTHTPGTNQSVISNTFTASSAQSCQAAALFNQASGGIMNHELTFTQRALFAGDVIQVSYTITLG